MSIIICDECASPIDTDKTEAFECQGFLMCEQCAALYEEMEADDEDEQ